MIRGRYIVVVENVYTHARRKGRASTVRRAKKLAYELACTLDPFGRGWVRVDRKGRGTVSQCKPENEAGYQHARSLPTVADVGYW
jgi:hypothetical protein